MLRVLARASELARLQVVEVMQSLPHVVYSLETLQTFGDRHKEVSLLDAPQRDFFTDALDAALVRGTGDVAVHSAKDLPFPLPAGLALVALTECLDSSDSLVCRSHASLTELPEGVRVGTSSLTRARQIREVRPDLEIVSIRGTIGERIAQVDSGHVDALIVATCALMRLSLTDRIAQRLPFATHRLQGHLAVVARDSRPDLAALFSAVDCRRKYGKVWIVGAGPGDPDLLTLRADALLSGCDMILHDDLISPRLLGRYRAEKRCIGKRKGKHSSDQDAINEMLYAEAVQGTRVVRLKGGDPYVFGRGGEEADFLGERFIPVEVVPGISSMQAAAAATGVPLTDRRYSASLELLSGHGAGDRPPQHGKTVAVFMGASTKQAVAQQIAERGADGTTPVVLVRNASLPDEESVFTTLDALASSEIASPVMILAGAAAKHRVSPRRILYTGLDSTECLLDGRIVHYPLIATEALDASVDLMGHDAIVFTSRTAARLFLGSHTAGDRPVFAVGPRTAAAIRAAGHRVAAVPHRFDADALNDVLSSSPHRSILYPCSSRSENALHRNPAVHPVPVYRTVSVTQPRLNLATFTGIVFSSPSTVDAFLALYREVPAHLCVYVYGSVTRKRLVSAGVDDAHIIQMHLHSRTGDSA